MIYYLFILEIVFCLFQGETAPPGVLDLSRCPKAAQAFQKGDYSQAFQESNKACPKLALLSRWKQLREGQGKLTFQDYKEFLERHPDWPWKNDLRRQAEFYLTPQVPATVVIKWYTGHAPKTLRGVRAYAEALHQVGSLGQRKHVLQEAWAKIPLPDLQEREFLEKYGKDLSAQAHVDRFNRLLESKFYKEAARQLLRCPASKHAALKVRLKFAEGDPAAEEAYKALPDTLQTERHLLKDYLAFLQKKEDPRVYEFFDHYRGVMEKAPSHFWKIRYVMARDALAHKDYGRLRHCLHRHGMKDADAYVQAEWLLGWTALRFEQDPQTALQHLKPAYVHLQEVSVKTQFAYWIGEAFLALGQKDQAHLWFKKAAAHPQTFYGQLASKKLGMPLSVSFKPLTYSTQTYQKVTTHPLVVAALVLKHLKKEEDIPAFLYAASHTLSSFESKKAFLGWLKRDFPEFLYEVARYMGLSYTFKECYPMRTDLVPPCEHRALFHALIRKESGFNPTVISSAGARGLMQVMPETAFKVAKKLNISVTVEDLIKRPKHNVLIGTTYFTKKLAHYGGDKAVTLAAYNAGPRRADRWMARYGDPRTGEIDQATWIELIPYAETRFYVKRVLENEKVYDHLFARLGTR